MRATGFLVRFASTRPASRNGQTVKTIWQDAKVQIMIRNAPKKKSTDARRATQKLLRALIGSVLLATMLFALAEAASAQTASSSNSLASSNIFAGYSFFADNLYSGQHADLSGWRISAEKKYLPFFGVVGDIGGAYGSANSTCASSYPGQCIVHASISEYTFQAGIRGSYAASTVRPFGEALFGGARTGESGPGQSNANLGFAATLGAGIDCRLTRILGCRLVVDYVVTGNFNNARQNSVRVSTGLVVRF